MIKLKKMNLVPLLEEVLKNLNEREKDVILKRYGIFNKSETLEDIGKDYGLTRERVRQIQNQALRKILPILKEHQEIERIMEKTKALLGSMGVKKETSFHLLLKENLNLSEVNLKIYRFFALYSEKVIFHPADDDFHSFYARDQEIYTAARHTLKKLYLYFLENHQELFPQEKVIEISKKEIKLHLKKEPTPEEILDFLKILKHLAKNPFHDWGLKTHPFIVPTCLKDKIFLILKQEGKPLHYSQIYQKLNQLKEIKEEIIDPSWQKEYNIESLKNELIKHEDFVFVGKGTYGLKEWNLIPGSAKALMLEYLKIKKKVTRAELWQYLSSLRPIKKSSYYVYLKKLKPKLKTEGNYLIYYD